MYAPHDPQKSWCVSKDRLIKGASQTDPEKNKGTPGWQPHVVKVTSADFVFRGTVRHFLDPQYIGHILRFPTPTPRTFEVPRRIPQDTPRDLQPCVFVSALQSTPPVCDFVFTIASCNPLHVCCRAHRGSALGGVSAPTPSQCELGL